MDKKKKELLLQTAAKAVKLLTPEDKLTILSFLAKFGIDASVSDGRLFFLESDKSLIFKTLHFFNVWFDPNLKYTKERDLCFISLNTLLLCEISWFSNAILSYVDGVIEIPNEPNQINSHWNFVLARKFTNNFRWFVALTLMSILDLDSSLETESQESDGESSVDECSEVPPVNETVGLTV